MKIGDRTAQGQSDQLPKPYIGLFTRDLSLGNGTQSITGLGYKPSSVTFFVSVSNGDHASWGWDTLTQEVGIEQFADNDTFASFAGGGSSIRLNSAATGFDIAGTITSLDTDGFTITWSVLSGSPTGTASIAFMAFK